MSANFYAAGKYTGNRVMFRRSTSTCLQGAVALGPIAFLIVSPNLVVIYCLKKLFIRKLGAIQRVIRNEDGGGGGCQMFREKRYEGARFNVISVTKGGMGGGPISRKNSTSHLFIFLISNVASHLLYKAAVFFVCLSVCTPLFFDTTVGPQPNLAHIFG